MCHIITLLLPVTPLSIPPIVLTSITSIVSIQSLPRWIQLNLSCTGVDAMEIPIPLTMWCAACSGEIDISGNHISSCDPGQPAGGSDNCAGGIHSNGGYHAYPGFQSMLSPKLQHSGEGLGILSSALQPIPSHLVRSRFVLENLWR